MDTKDLERAEDILAHFGVKGMRWGQRKSNSGSNQQPKKHRKAKAAAVGVGLVAGASVVGHLLGKYGKKTYTSIKIPDYAITDRHNIKTYGYGPNARIMKVRWKDLNDPAYLPKISPMFR